MHFDLSASNRVTMNSWVQIPRLLSTLPLARWPLWAVSGQYKLIASNLELSKVSFIAGVCQGRFYCTCIRSHYKTFSTGILDCQQLFANVLSERQGRYS